MWSPSRGWRETMTNDIDDGVDPTEDQATEPLLPDIDGDSTEYLAHHGVREGRWIHDHERACYYYCYRVTPDEVVAVAAPNVIAGAGLDPDAWDDPAQWSPMAIGDECVETHPAKTVADLAEALLDGRIRVVSEGVVKDALRIALAYAFDQLGTVLAHHSPAHDFNGIEGVETVRDLEDAVEFADRAYNNAGRSG